MKIFSVQHTGITVRQDYTFEGALILQELKVCYKKLYINQMQERKCPGRGNTEVSRNSIDQIFKKGLAFGAQRGPDA